MKIPSVIGLIVLLEIAREVYVLHSLGFKPARFRDWLRNDAGWKE